MRWVRTPGVGMSLVCAITYCVLLVLLVVAIRNYTSLNRYWLERESVWRYERTQWQAAVDSRDETISWWESKPPGVVEVPVEIVKEVPVDVIKEVDVVKYIDKDFTPVPFGSTADLRAWVDDWESWMPAFGGTIVLNGSCENLAYAMMIDAVNDGYLVGTQIDPTSQHMMVVVPVYSENRYLFVEPDDRTISLLFMGREWRIN